MRLWPSALALLAITASCTPPGPPLVVAVAPVEASAPVRTVNPAALALEPAPRPGSARRFIRLSTREPGSAPVRVSLDVPAAWGMRVRDAGGRALRPCQVSPSSPSELFLLARPKCLSAPCNDHEKLIDDLESALIALTEQVQTSASETLAPDVHITRLTGDAGSAKFTAFRLVKVDAQSSVPVSCEAFLFSDERAYQAEYEAACRTLRTSPEDWQEGPEDLAAAPDGEARSPVDDSIAQSAVGYLSALSSRDARTAALFLLTSDECAASGGDPVTCEAGQIERRNGVIRGVEAVPTSFLPGAADVRYPSALPGLAIATVKRRGDPCGPGYEVTLARGQKRYAIVSPEPTPDPRLAPPSR